MIITHNINWSPCLSKKIYPAIKEGWKDEGRPVHFFWGLGADLPKQINEVIKRNEEWWYVDVGYITADIKRYPTPEILDYENTYFRICRGGIHSSSMKEVSSWPSISRTFYNKNTCFTGWNNNPDGHILIAPSSEIVTRFINNRTQAEWVNKVTERLKKVTDKEIRFRNKPRPSNKWWNTDIKDDLKEAYCLVTNMSLSAIDAIMMGIPIICDKKHVARPISSTSINDLNKPDVNGWLQQLGDNQFTLKEIKNGTAYDYLK